MNRGQGRGREGRRPPGGRRWRSGVAWLAVASLLALLFMPCPGDPPGAGAGHHGSGGICALAGHRGPAPGGDRPDPGAPDSGGHGACPFCLAHAGYSPPPPQAPAPALVPPPVRTAPAVLARADDWCPVRHFFTSPQSRAPPDPV